MDTQLILTILLIGLGAGLLSGLVGTGGGIIMVPALIFFLHYTQHQAQGTSLAVLTLPVVILASFQYYTQCKLQGNPINLQAVALLAAGFIGGGYFGSKWALSVNQGQLKQWFAMLLLYTAARMLEWDQWVIHWFKKS